MGCWRGSWALARAESETVTPADLLPDRFARWAGDTRAAFRFVDRPGRPVREMSWADFWAAAVATARALDAAGLRQARVGVACEDTADFVVGLAGALIGGHAVVPFPVALSRRSAGRARAIAEAARPVAILVSPGREAPDWVAEPGAREPTAVVPVARPSGDGAGGWRPPPIAATDLALVQFSSGSTGTPQGVGLSHGNVATNCAAIATAYGLDSASRGLCWLPLHHDMGLVGHVLTGMWTGGRSTLMDPLRFLQRPLDWLRLASAERATITSAPNFAYEICVKAAEKEDLGDLDLKSITAAICGGEPVLSRTVRRFLDAFAAAGLSPAAFAPSYGLAEATLLVASGRTAAGPRFVAAEASGPPAGPAGEAAGLVADLGSPVDGVDVRIIDEAGNEAPEGAVGEIEVSGASVGRLIGADGRLAPARPLMTGDLGFLSGGRVHVVGRKKDLIIVRGQNVHPSDVEAAALEAHRAIVPGGLAAVGVAVDGTEELAVLVEVDGRALSGPDEIGAVRGQVSELVARRVGVVPAEVVALRPGALPRTSSGKVRRFEAADLLRAGKLARVDRRSPANEPA